MYKRQVPALIAAHGGDTCLRLTLDRPAPGSLATVEHVSSVEADGAATVVRGSGAFVQNALAHLTETGVGVTSMSTSSPGLEDVFLNLTGRALREAH